MSFKVDTFNIGLYNTIGDSNHNDQQPEELLHPIKRHGEDNVDRRAHGKLTNQKAINHRNFHFGASGRYTYTDDELQRIFYNMPPMDRVKLSQILKKQGNWVALYNDLKERYSVDQINALMHGGTAHFQTDYSSTSSFAPGHQHLMQNHKVQMPLGPNGMHSMNYHMASYAGRPNSLQGNKKHGLLDYIFGRYRSEGESDLGTSRQIDIEKSSPYEYSGADCDIVPHMNGF